MDNQLTGAVAHLNADTTILALTERHLQEWIDLLDRLHNTQASAEEVALCQRQITHFRQGIGQLQGI